MDSGSVAQTRGASSAVAATRGLGHNGTLLPGSTGIHGNQHALCNSNATTDGGRVCFSISGPTQSGNIAWEPGPNTKFPCLAASLTSTLGKLNLTTSGLEVALSFRMLDWSVACKSIWYCWSSAPGYALT